ncbi:MAG TPA: FAD-dependent oxidoreductase [Amycolatopsis sp.]|nr:FAD-dependent oxidoreductase [Amycolatopsis sp.]
MDAHTADLVVIGSGGGGLLAACVAADAGHRVLVLERTPFLGGTTAISGGMIWVPDNPLMAAAGFPDSAADALRYLRLVTEGTVADEHLEQFVGKSPEMVRYLLSRTPAGLFPISRPDYHPDWPGAREGGRTLDNAPFPAAPEVRARIRSGSAFPPLTYDELHRARWDPGAYRALIARREATGMLTVGAALVAALVTACDDRGVEFRTGTRARRLRTEGARITGVLAETDGSPVTFRATAGVVLASGGFEWNARLKQAFLGKPDTVAVSPPYNHGDGQVMAAEAGAALGNLSEAWWAPVVSAPEECYDGEPRARHIVAERCLPGSIMVNRAGRRFVNEAVNYNDITKALHVLEPSAHRRPNDPAWLVFDEGFRRRYPIAGVAPTAPPPSWFATGGSLTELAKAIDVDADALTRTVETFNRGARDGVDPEFGRGGSAHDRYYGDGERPGNPCLAPLEEPPYFAVEVRPGTLGTKGGVVTDVDGRVLRYDDEPIPGLFACGNVTASVMGPGYPGSGGTLGPALLGGYLCGKTASGKETP